MRKVYAMFMYLSIYQFAFSDDLGSTGTAVYNIYYFLSSIINIISTLFIETFMGKDNIFNSLSLFEGVTFQSIGISILIVFFMNSLLNKLFYIAKGTHNSFAALASFAEATFHLIIGGTLITNSNSIMNALIEYLGITIQNLNSLILVDISTLKTMLKGQNFVFSIFIGIIYIIPTILGLMFSFYIMKEVIVRSLKLFLLKIQAPIFFGLTTSNFKSHIFYFLWRVMEVLFEMLPIYVVVYITKHLPTLMLAKGQDVFTKMNVEYGAFYEEVLNIDISKAESNFNLFILNILVLAFSYLMLKEGTFKTIFNIIGGTNER